MSGDQNDPDEAHVGKSIDDDPSYLSSILGHAYRGELDRETTWRSRLDQTTTWTVTIMAALLTWAFSSPDNPHYIVLIGVIITTVFLLIEARRYRDYDVYRSRIRLFQQNLFAPALDPDRGLEHSDWRAELSEDYRRPTVKISLREAIAHRLKRIYAALLGVLLFAWVFRVTAFAPTRASVDDAAIGTVPGSVVVVIVAAYFLVVAAVTVWPREREAKEEFREGEYGEWKGSE
ncbi:hypothetical protein C479_12574 [Halovivax asiaticus JCM 14624]|uniref:DUF2270 domain-containing protein n=1 Tax=Halovivax asiaticus JCM 14624 TaxID=1227490 RepID=M0BDI8_9EURY|nr:DUF2270 domain-containing protein [Halovivax asiaticus]ELZ08961.1 hypothetical protein C479_12574 [Halovivax asiaticus JCM 14624]